MRFLVVDHILRWKFSLLQNGFYFDLLLRYPLIKYSFKSFGIVNSSLLFNFSIVHPQFYYIFKRLPILFSELSFLWPTVLFGFFKWISRKKAVILHLTSTIFNCSSNLLTISSALFCSKKTLAVLIQRCSFFFFNSLFTFRLLLIDVTKLKRISGELFYDWIFSFQFEISIKALTFFQFKDFIFFLSIITQYLLLSNSLINA